MLQWALDSEQDHQPASLVSFKSFNKPSWNEQTIIYWMEPIKGTMWLFHLDPAAVEVCSLLLSSVDLITADWQQLDSISPAHAADWLFVLWHAVSHEAGRSGSSGEFCDESGTFWEENTVTLRLWETSHVARRPTQLYLWFLIGELWIRNTDRTSAAESLSWRSCDVFVLMCK